MPNALIGQTCTSSFTSSSDSSSTRPLNRRERAAVLSRIQALMSFWQITVEELEHAAPTVKATPVRPVKYRHPVSGLTWDGDGPHPQWLRDALLKEGLRVDELKPELQASPDRSLLETPGLVAH